MPSVLSLLVLRCCDVESTRNFYGGLGLHFEPEQHGSGPLHYAAEVGGMVVEIYPLKSGQMEADDSTMLGFQVGALEGVLAELGVEVDIKSSQRGRFCNVKDPDGRTVRLTEENS